MWKIISSLFYGPYEGVNFNQTEYVDISGFFDVKKKMLLECRS